jgi:hypothetical protein
MDIDELLPSHEPELHEVVRAAERLADGDPKVASDLRRLTGEQREALSRSVVWERSTVAESARAELDDLSTKLQQYRDAIVGRAAADDDLIEKRLADLDGFYLELHQLQKEKTAEERQMRARIDTLRLDREIAQVRSQFGPASSVARRPARGLWQRFRKRQAPPDELQQLYEEIQNKKKEIADIVTSTKRLELNLDNTWGQLIARYRQTADVDEKRRLAASALITAVRAVAYKVLVPLYLSWLELNVRAPAEAQSEVPPDEPTETSKASVLGEAALETLTAPSLSVPQQTGTEFDVFVSHASEDKVAVARPLALALKSRKLRVWLDEQELSLGDSLTEKIDQGLQRSRFGVVVLSQSFFAKSWPKRELDGLVARETAAGTKVILPVWHKVTLEDVAQQSPILAGRLAIDTGVGIERVADAVVRAAAIPKKHGDV